MMFNSQQCSSLRQLLPDFSFDQAIGPSAPGPAVVQNYLEYYGFYETLKALTVDFFIGYRSVVLAGQSYRVATFYWRPSHPKGAVFLVHGLFDHAGLFQPLVRHLLSQGYAVIMVDLPGHGISDGEPTAINGFTDYAAVVQDTLAGFQSELGILPVYGLGQSTGAAVLMTMAFASAASGSLSPFQRLVFLGPLVRPRKWVLVALGYRLLGRLIRRVNRDFSIASSHDEQFLNFLRNHDPLQSRTLSLRWVGALFDWVNKFPAQPSVLTPLLVVQGTEDYVVDWQHNVPAIQQHFSDAQISYIQGAMHHLPNEAEPWRKAIFTSITQSLRPRPARCESAPGSVNLGVNQ